MHESNIFYNKLQKTIVDFNFNNSKNIDKKNNIELSTLDSNNLLKFIIGVRKHLETSKSKLFFSLKNLDNNIQSLINVKEDFNLSDTDFETILVDFFSKQPIFKKDTENNENSLNIHEYLPIELKNLKVKIIMQGLKDQNVIFDKHTKSFYKQLIVLKDFINNFQENFIVKYDFFYKKYSKIMFDIFIMKNKLKEYNIREEKIKKFKNFYSKRLQLSLIHLDIMLIKYNFYNSIRELLFFAQMNLGDLIEYSGEKLTDTNVMINFKYQNNFFDLQNETRIQNICFFKNFSSFLKLENDLVFDEFFSKQNMKDITLQLSIYDKLIHLKGQFQLPLLMETDLNQALLKVENFFGNFLIENTAKKNNNIKKKLINQEQQKELEKKFENIFFNLNSKNSYNEVYKNPINNLIMKVIHKNVKLPFLFDNMFFFSENYTPFENDIKSTLNHFFLELNLSVNSKFNYSFKSIIKIFFKQNHNLYYNLYINPNVKNNNSTIKFSLFNLNSISNKLIIKPMQIKINSKNNLSNLDQFFNINTFLSPKETLCLSNYFQNSLNKVIEDFDVPLVSNYLNILTKEISYSKFYDCVINMIKDHPRDFFFNMHRLNILSKNLIKLDYIKIDQKHYNLFNNPSGFLYEIYNIKKSLYLNIKNLQFGFNGFNILVLEINRYFNSIETSLNVLFGDKYKSILLDIDILKTKSSLNRELAFLISNIFNLLNNFKIYLEFIDLKNLNANEKKIVDDKLAELVQNLILYQKLNKKYKYFSSDNSIVNLSVFEDKIESFKNNYKIFVKAILFNSRKTLSYNLNKYKVILDNGIFPLLYNKKFDNFSKIGFYLDILDNDVFNITNYHLTDNKNYSFLINLSKELSLGDYLNNFLIESRNVYETEAFFKEASLKRNKFEQLSIKSFIISKFGYFIDFINFFNFSKTLFDLIGSNKLNDFNFFIISEKFFKDFFVFNYSYQKYGFNQNFKDFKYNYLNNNLYYNYFLYNYKHSIYIYIKKLIFYNVFYQKNYLEFNNFFDKKYMSNTNFLKLYLLFDYNKKYNNINDNTINNYFYYNISNNSKYYYYYNFLNEYIIKDINRYSYIHLHKKSLISIKLYNKVMNFKTNRTLFVLDNGNTDLVTIKKYMIDTIDSYNFRLFKSRLEMKKNKGFFVYGNKYNYTLLKKFSEGSFIHKLNWFYYPNYYYKLLKNPLNLFTKYFLKLNNIVFFSYLSYNKENSVLLNSITQLDSELFYYKKVNKKNNSFSIYFFDTKFFDFMNSSILKNNIKFNNNKIQNFCNFTNNINNKLQKQQNIIHNKKINFLNQKINEIFTYSEYEKFKNDHHHQRFRAVFPYWIQRSTRNFYQIIDPYSESHIGAKQSSKTKRSKFKSEDGDNVFMHAKNNETKVKNSVFSFKQIGLNRDLFELEYDIIKQESDTEFTPIQPEYRPLDDNIAMFIPYKYSKWYTNNPRLSLKINSEFLNFFLINQISEIKYIFYQSVFLLKRKLMFDVFMLKSYKYKQNILYNINLNCYENNNKTKENAEFLFKKFSHINFSYFFNFKNYIFFNFMKDFFLFNPSIFSNNIFYNSQKEIYFKASKNLYKDIGLFYQNSRIRGGVNYQLIFNVIDSFYLPFKNIDFSDKAYYPKIEERRSLFYFLNQHSNRGMLINKTSKNNHWKIFPFLIESPKHPFKIHEVYSDYNINLEKNIKNFDNFFFL